MLLEGFKAILTWKDEDSAIHTAAEGKLENTVHAALYKLLTVLAEALAARPVPT